MKIADYGKAITSYIESPTTAQKLQAKEKAQTLGRTLLADGSEDIVEPSKSMKVDTTTKGLDLFTLQDFKDKAEIYVGAYHNNALPIDDIRSALNKFTQKGIDDGTFSADDAIKIVQDLKFQVKLAEGKATAADKRANEVRNNSRLAMEMAGKIKSNTTIEVKGAEQVIDSTNIKVDSTRVKKIGRAHV